MKFPQDTTTQDPDTGGNCRGFMILCDNPNRLILGQPHRVSYPANGSAYFPGPKALQCMETLTGRGMIVTAYTAAHGVNECLTLDQMRSQFLYPVISGTI